MKYRKKPVVVEAEQFLPPRQIPKGVINVYQMGENFTGEVWTIHGQKATVAIGDWIITEPDGMHYHPCKPDIFEATYEAVENE